MMLLRIQKTVYLGFWDISADIKETQNSQKKDHMNAHNHSQFRLNPLPDGKSTSLPPVMTATLPPLDEIESSTHSAHQSQELFPDILPAPQAKRAEQSSQAVAGQAFCQFCGGRVAADAVLCVSCGRQIKALHGALATVETKPDEKPASAAEFVLMVIFTLIIPIAGFVFGVIGLSRRGKQAQGGVLLGLSLIVAAFYFFVYLTAHQ